MLARVLSKQTGRKTIIQMAHIAHTLRGRKLKAALSCRPCCRAVMFFAARNYCAFVKIYATWACHFTGLHTHTQAVVIDWKTSLQHTQSSLPSSDGPSPCIACCNCLKAFAICYNVLCCCGKSFAAEKCAYLVFSTSYLLPVECTQISCTRCRPWQLLLCASFDKLL